MQPWPEMVDDSIYPASDGKPMAETPLHVAAIILLLQALEDYFARKTDVFCAANIFWYYEEGKPKKRVSPDVLVARGVARRRRRSFFTWREGTVPCVVFEITSKKTRREDLGSKRELYERQGVAEYFLFDPDGSYLKPPLQGFRLKKGKYVTLQPAADGSLTSTELGLRLVAEDEMLRLIRAKSGKHILTRAEKAEQAEQRAGRAEQRAGRAEQRAGRAEQRADNLAAEVEALKAELERLQKGQS
jgi:Uma2 family endonuclease